MQNRGVQKIYYSAHFLESLSKITAQVERDFLKRESLFLKDPFHRSLKTHKLSGIYQDFYAFWVNYRYRIMFKFLINDSEIIFVNIGTHEIYK